MKRLLKYVLVSLLLFQLGTVTVRAEETSEDIEKNENSVVQLVVFWADSAGNEYPIQGGSGFFIGNEEAGAEYIITAKEVTFVNSETDAQLSSLYISEEEDIRYSYITRAIVKRDVMLDLQLVAESEELGFSIWKLSQPLYDRKPLVLYDKSLTGTSGTKVVTMGFPTAANYIDETIFYSTEEVISKTGLIIGDSEEDKVTYLYHNIAPEPGILGGPILNENGDVLAVNQQKEAQNGYHALQIAEVLPILEALGVPYITTSQIEAQKQAELAAIVHKEELHEGILAAEGIDKNLYFKDSYAILETCLAEARGVEGNEQATQEEVDAILAKLRTSVMGLKPKPALQLVLGVIAVVVLVIILIFAIVWRKTKPKREQKKRQKILDYTVTQAAPIFNGAEVKKEDYRQLVMQNSGEIGSREYIVSQPENGGDDTTVFQQDPVYSTRLQKEDKKTYAYLVRKRTGEQIAITEKEFVLGKDPSQTDYCIKGNSAVSRAHAVIICNGPEVSVSDKNATNGTFVNDMRVNAFQKATLKDGDVLRLADELFEFKRS